MNKQDFLTLLRSPEAKEVISDVVDNNLKFKVSKEKANSKEAAKRETRKK